MIGRHVIAVLCVALLLVSGIGAGLTGGVGEQGPIAPDRLQDGGVDTAGAVGAGVDGLGPWGLAHQLMGLKAASGLSDEERALYVVEAVSRHQVKTLGLDWNDEVFIPSHASPSEAVRGLSGHLGGAIGPEQEAGLQELDALPEGVRDALIAVIDAFYALDLAAKGVNAGVDVEDYLEGLDRDLPGVPVEGLQDVFAARLELVRAAFELKAALEDALEESGDEVKVPSLMVPMGHQQEGHPDFEQGGLGENDPLLICINNHDGNNVYSKDCLLLIDTSLAGDKRYHNNAGGFGSVALEGGAAALIDFSGDNRYGNPLNPRGNGANGGAYAFGVGLATAGTGALLSLGSGDGTFTAGSQGVNGGGVTLASPGRNSAIGFLFSMGGNDRFEAKSLGVNGGAHRENTWFDGVAQGTLLNMAGDDTYVASGGQAVNGGASGTGGLGLLLDVDGTNLYRDPSLPNPTEGSYICMESGDCGFEDDGETRSCWNCSVVPKGTLGMQIDFAVSGLSESQVDLPPCQLPFCQRLFFRGDRIVDEMGMPNVANAATTGKLLPEAPTGTVPVVHSGSGIHIKLITDPFDEPVAIGRGSIFANVNNEATARYFFADTDWTRIVWNNPNYRLKVSAVQVDDAPVDDTQVVLGEIAVSPGSRDSLVPQQRDFKIPLSFPSSNTDPMDADGNPIPHYNNDFDIVIPEGYALELVIWVSSGIFQEGLVYSVFYDSVDFASHIDFRVTDLFEPSTISLDWGDGVLENEDGTLNFTAGEDVEFWARGYNETGGFVQNVAAQWSVDPPERGSFSVDDVTQVATFTPRMPGKGNITATFHGSGTSPNATVDIWVKKGDIKELRIHDASGGAGAAGPFQFVPTQVVPLYVAGYDAGGNFIEDVSVAVNNWDVDPDIGSFTDENGVVRFHAEKPGAGVIGAEPDGLELFVTAEIEIAFGELDTIRIQTEDEAGKVTNETDLGPLQTGIPIELIAAGYDAFDNFLGNVEGAHWSVDPPDLGDFIEQGDHAVFEPRIVGAGVMAASHNGVASDPVAFEVIPGEPARLGIAQPPEWAIDQPVSFVVWVEDEFFNKIQSTSEFDGLDVNLRLTQGDGELTGDVTVTMSDRQAIFNTGYCCQVKEGGIEIAMNATNEDGEVVFEGAFHVDLVPGPLARLEIQDDLTNQVGPFELTAGDNMGLVAAGFDAHENEKGIQEVEWRLTRYADQETDEALADSATGFLFWRKTAGEAEITVRSAGVSDTVIIQVRPADLNVIRIFTEPGDHDAEDHVTALGPFTAGDQVDLFAAGYDAFDNFLGQVAVGWGEDPDDIGFLNTSAQTHAVRFTAGKIGTGFLNVTHPGLQGPSIGVSVGTHGPTPRELAFETEGDVEMIAGETWPQIAVRVEDGFKNRVMTDHSTTVTLRLGKGFPEELGGQLTTTAQDGLAVFDDVSYNLARSVWIVAEADAADTNEDSVESASMGPYHVRPAEIERFRIETGPNGKRSLVLDLEMHAGTSSGLSAAGFDRFDNYAGDVSVEWSVAPQSLGSFGAGGGPNSGVFTANQEGTGTITATHDALGTQSTNILVHPGNLDHVMVRTAAGGTGEAVAALQVDAGDAVELFVAGYDAQGNYVGDVTAWWRVDPPRLGVLDPMDATVNTTFSAESRGTGRIVVDPEGLPGDVEISLVIEADPVPPTAGFTESCDEVECFFDASSSKRGDAAIQGYQWDLGDGTTRSGESFFHPYEEEGKYIVTLNVTARDGLSDEVTKAVVVSLLPNAEIHLQVTPDPVNPRPRDAVTITALIENVGSVDLVDFRVKFYVDEELVRAQDYPRLRAGESMNVRTMWGALEGEQLISVEVPGYASESRSIRAGNPDRVEEVNEGEEKDAGDDVVVNHVEEAPGFGWAFMFILVLAVIGLARRCENQGFSWWWNSRRIGPTAIDQIVSREGLSSSPHWIRYGRPMTSEGIAENMLCTLFPGKGVEFQTHTFDGSLDLGEGATFRELEHTIEGHSNKICTAGVSPNRCVPFLWNVWFMVLKPEIGPAAGDPTQSVQGGAEQ